MTFVHRTWMKIIITMAFFRAYHSIKWWHNFPSHKFFHFSSSHFPAMEVRMCVCVHYKGKVNLYHISEIERKAYAHTYPYIRERAWSWFWTLKNRYKACACLTDEWQWLWFVPFSLSLSLDPIVVAEVDPYQKQSSYLSDFSVTPQ